MLMYPAFQFQQLLLASTRACALLASAREIVTIGTPPPEPESVFNRICVSGLFGLMVRVGRITPSFRRLLLAEIDRLYKRYRPALRDPLMQEVFDALIRVWSRESPAMIVSNLPLPLDARAINPLLK